MRRSGFGAALAAGAFSAVVAGVLIGSAQVAVAAAGSDGAPARPTLQVERDRVGDTLIYVGAVGGGAPRQLLHRTSATVTPGATGVDQGGAAQFVTWEEAGQRWFSVSQDSGRTWWESRPVDTRLMLRDGQPVPGQAMPATGLGLALSGQARVFVVQFRTISIPEWRDALLHRGVEVLAHLPHNGYIVRLDPTRVPELRGLDFVERVEPFHPWYRISPEVRAWLEAPGLEGESLRMRVSAFEWGDTGKRRIAAAAQALGAEIALWYPSAYIIEINLTRAQVRALAGHDDVAWIEAWTPKENDMDITRQDSGADWAEQNFGYCGTGVRGEVLDAGFETTHQDFDGILLHGTVNSDSHGTSTYGEVFGNGARDGDGQAKATGHLPCAQGIAADYDNLTDRFAHTQQLRQAPYFASFQSNSWGDARTRDYTSISQEMDDIIWRLDFAILQSQSNAGNQDSRPQAWSKNIISIGAVNHYDTISPADDCWCSGASIGPAADGRLKPDIAYWYDDIYTTTTGNSYTSGFGGTSGATPQSAGVVGIMLQMWSENVWGTNPVGSTVFERKPHASTIKALAINNSQQWTFSGSSSDLARVKQGWGRPSVQLAKQRAARSFVIDESVPLRVNEKASYDVDVLSGEAELKVTLVFNDIPGTTSATLHRINDLDLTVTSPSGTIYRGNFGLDAANYSPAGGTRDGKNNVENVFVQNPQAGVWKVEIEAREINQDQYLSTPQADAVFALVSTGGAGSICLAPTADFTATPNPAQVGQTVTFSSNVTGGAGGPFTYQWDLNADGTIDSTAVSPTYVYHRPFAGNAKLTVRDSIDCPELVEKSQVVNGPDLRVNDYVSLVQVQGNNNGAVDPGEIFDVNIRLRNDGNAPASSVTARVRPSAANVGPVGMIVSDVFYGELPIGFISGGTPVRFQVGQSFPCGNDLFLDLYDIDSTTPANRFPEELGKIRILVGGAGPTQQFFADGLDTNSGWSLTGSSQWQFGAPQGKGGGGTIPGQPVPKPDPASAFAGAGVLGNDLTGLAPSLGNYESLENAIATSPPINCADAVEVSIQFARWLNVLPNDEAAFEVTRDGVTWTPLLLDNDGQTASAWVLSSYDVSLWANRNPSFRIRFRLTSDNVGTGAGWNVDDIRLFGVTSDSCEPVARATPGSVGSLTVGKAGANLNLSWSNDCGGTTRYGIYRGQLSSGYGSIAPVPGQCDVTGSSISIPQGAGSADFYLVVPNDGGFEGGYGFNSSGAARAPSANACHPRDTVNSCTP